MKILLIKSEKFTQMCMHRLTFRDLHHGDDYCSSAYALLSAVTRSQKSKLMHRLTFRDLHHGDDYCSSAYALLSAVTRSQKSKLNSGFPQYKVPLISYIHEIYYEKKLLIKSEKFTQMCMHSVLKCKICIDKMDCKKPDCLNM